jgi:hypothetical protein
VILLFLSKIFFLIILFSRIFYFFFSIFFHLSNFSIDVQTKIIIKILNYLITNNDHERILILFSFFRNIPIGRVLDIIIDYFLSINIDQYEWIIKP